MVSIAQGGIIIGNGAKVFIKDSPHWVIQNGRFENNGDDFVAGSSTVHITGNSLTGFSTIGGTATTAFYNLTINKSSNDVRLNYDIEVEGDLQISNGNLILNNSDIILGGNILGEAEGKQITGTTGGTIIKTVDLNMPLGENPGNIGVEITSVENMGSTTIQRRHVQLTNNGNSSIYRHFNISPTNNAALDATLRMYYFDNELAGLTENDIDLWQYNGATWVELLTDSRNTAENWVESSGIPFFHTLTLAENLSPPLPVELISFNAVANEKKEVDIFWSTASESNNEYFSVERSRDGVQFEQIDIVPGAGSSSDTRYYATIDPHPFIGINYYRLRQVDYDGRYNFSKTKSVYILTDGQVAAYPNPMQQVLHIVGEGFTKDEEAVIEIHDALGKLVFSQIMAIQRQSFLLDVPEVAGFFPGSYFLSIRTPNENRAFNLVKIGE